MLITNLPYWMIKHILSFTDVVSAVKYSMTNRYNLNKYYPQNDVVDVKNTIDYIKSKINKRKKANMYDYTMYMTDEYYDYVTGVCDIKYCNICEGVETWNKFYYEIGVCTNCAKQCIICNKTNLEKSSCVLCDKGICDDCTEINNNLGGFSCDFNIDNPITDHTFYGRPHSDTLITCYKCAELNYYCKGCKTKRCMLCIKQYGDFCSACKYKNHIENII